MHSTCLCGSSKLTGIALLPMTVRDHCGQPGEAAEPETAAGGWGSARRGDQDARGS